MVWLPDVWRVAVKTPMPFVSETAAGSLAFLSLLVIFFPGAMFRASRGICKGGPGLSGMISAVLSGGAALGVPAKTGAGSFNTNGTQSVALVFSASSASRGLLE